MTTTTQTPPEERSLAQRMDALERANDVRSRRAQLKRDIKSGRAKPVTVLVDPPAHILTMKVIDLLMAVPKYGRVKTNRMLTQIRMSPSKTIGGMTERQRAELIAEMVLR